MKVLLDGDEPRLVVLRQQYAAATVKGREFSGVGFFTNFEVPSTAPKVSPPDFELGARTLLQLDGLKHGAGVVLFVRKGILDMLEGYTFDEPWPANPRLLAIERSDEEHRAPSA